MSAATQREYRKDKTGVKRLVAAAGDTAVDAEASADGPPTATMAGQNYSPTPDVDQFQGSAPPVVLGADGTHAIGEVKRAGTVTSATLVPDSAITGAATNNRRVRVINKGSDGTGTTIVAELAFGSGTNASVSDEKALTLSATAANLKVAVGDVLAYESTHIGTGIADPGGLVQVEVQPKDA